MALCQCHGVCMYVYIAYFAYSQIGLYWFSLLMRKLTMSITDMTLSWRCYCLQHLLVAHIGVAFVSAPEG